MNNPRRKAIQSVINRLAAVKEDLETIKDEETDVMYNMPENLQNSDRYYRVEEAVEKLESAYDNLDEAIESLEEAME